MYGTTEKRTRMRLGERVRLELEAEGRAAGAEGVVVGFFRNGDRPDAIVSFADGETAVLPQSILAPLGDEAD